MPADEVHVDEGTSLDGGDHGAALLRRTPRRAQRQDVGDEPPGIALTDVLAVGGGEDVVVRWHGGAVEPGHERPVHVLGRRAALQPSLGEVERMLRVAPDVRRQRRGRGAVAASVLAVAGAALEPRVELLPARDRVGIAEPRGRRRHRDRRPEPARLPLRIEALDVGHQRPALALAEQRPVRHGRAVTPRVMTRKRSSSVGSEPLGVVRNLKTPPVKSRGCVISMGAATPRPSPCGPWHPTQ